jgi:hypothetical protein
MSTFRIRFGAQTTSDAGVPVEVISSNSVRVWKGILQMGGVVSADVKPGHYLVTAQLPNGSILRSQQTLDTENSVVDVRLVPELESPSESMGWAFYLQRSLFAPRHKRTGLRAPEFLGAPAHPQHSLPVDLRVWRCEDEEWFPISIRVSPSPTVDVRYRGVVDLNCSQLPAPYWLQCVSPIGSCFAALPRSEQSSLRAALTLNDNGTLAVAVGGFQPDADALLNYLTAGDFASARALGPRVEVRAEKILQDKVRDPVAATIAGYYLLKVGDLERLHDWSFNLANWFEHIPDGAIIAGWHAIRIGDPKKGARYFAIALRRGLPLFTLGLQQLLDGLLVTRELLYQEGIDPDDRARRLRGYVCASNQHSGVTSFAAMDPREPRPLP